MSDTERTDELVDRVEDTIADVLTTHGCVPMNYVAMCTYLDENGERAFSVLAPDEQFIDQTSSMVQFLSEYYATLRQMKIHQMLQDWDDPD